MNYAAVIPVTIVTGFLEAGKTTFQAKDVYWVKGIIYAEGHDKKVIVQSVMTDTAITTGARWKKDEERRSRIVFIRKNLKPAGFEKMLNNCLAAQSI